MRTESALKAGADEASERSPNGEASEAGRFNETVTRNPLHKERASRENLCSPKVFQITDSVG